MSDISPLDEIMSALGKATSQEHEFASARGADGDIEGVRGVWWSLARQGQRLPAQRDVILIRGGRS